MQFKSGQLVSILGCSKAVEDKWIDAINSACAKFSIDTKLRLAMFIAQVGHESGRLTAVTENLNYSADGLLKTWPNRFTAALAAACARQPEKIANVVYSSRMGNGDNASGEGWKFRGRGLIQCTGKSNYNAFSQACGINAIANPDSLAEPTNAALSAGWFWNSKNLNAYADRQDVTGSTKIINGGTNGLDDRQAIYKKALIVLGDDTLPKSDEELKATPVPQEPATTAPISSEKTPSAKNSSITEPRSAGTFSGKSQYPWNLVYESRSGHVTEVDDTPGAERLNMTHRAGSYWEIDPTGVFTHKSVLDSYKLTKEDSYEYTGGNYTEQVVGQSYTSVGGETSHKSGGNYFIEAPRVQVNSGMLAVSGQVVAPYVQADLLESPFANTLSKVAMVAWDLGGGSGGSGASAGSMQAAGNPVINGSFGFSGTPATEALRTNKLGSQNPDGTSATKNGIIAGLAAAVAGVSAAAGVAQIMKDNDLDPKVANAMSSAAEEIDGSATTSAAARTPVFLKHVAFDKPTLFSQSSVIDLPDPKLYKNNYHTVVDSTGKGVLHFSDGLTWEPVGGAGAKGYTDQQIKDLSDAVDGLVASSSGSTLTAAMANTAAAVAEEARQRALQIADEATERALALVAQQQETARNLAEEAVLRHDQITQGLLDEAIARGAAVKAEADARQTNELSTANLITTLTAAVGVGDAANAAAIQDEKNLRVDAVSAEATARLALATKVGQNTAAILNEATARSDGDSATATLVEQLSAKTDGKFAAVTTTTTALVDADQALASRVDALVVKTDNSNAAILTEQQVRIAQDSALATTIDSVLAQTNIGLNANAAAIVVEREARTDATSALATSIETVLAKTNLNTAAIATEQSARTTETSALASSIVTITANVASNAAAIVNESKARADLDSATATQFNALVVKTNATNASISTESEVRANAVSSLAGQISTVSSTVEVYNQAAQTGIGNVNAAASAAQSAAVDAHTAANAAQNSANAANQLISVISNDNILSKGEKSAIIREFNALVAEQAGIEAQGTLFSVFYERDQYSNSMNALRSYMSSLSPSYSDVNSDTAIDGAVFRAKFADAYFYRQNVLNRIDAAAKALADGAQVSANTALSQITDIASDNVLSRGEKGAIILEFATLTGEQAALEAQGTAFGLVTQRNAYSAAVNALRTYINGLYPAYNNTSLDTPIDGATFRNRFYDVYVAKVSLVNSIDSQAKSLADNAQYSANTALGTLATIASDNVLSRGEKSAVILEFTSLMNESASIINQGNAFGVEPGYYNGAINALSNYMNGLYPAYNDLNSDTPIVGTTFRQVFGDVYSTRQTLLNGIDAKAKALADNAQSTASTAIAQINNISSDNVLSRSEKGDLILEWTRIDNERPALVNQGNAFGVYTEVNSYSALVDQLAAYLSAMNPYWNDVTQDTPIDGAVFRSKFLNVYNAKITLTNRMDAQAKALADNAQNSANVANGQIANISSDNILSKGEKGPIILQFNTLIDESTAYYNQADLFGITTQKTAYQNAINTLYAYVVGLYPPFNDVSTDTAIDGATFRNVFYAVYLTRQSLVNAIDQKAKSIADSKAAVTRSANAPGNPRVGDTWIDISLGENLQIPKVWTGFIWQEVDWRTAKNSADIINETNTRTTLTTALAEQNNTIQAVLNNDPMNYVLNPRMDVDAQYWTGLARVDKTTLTGNLALAPTRYIMQTYGRDHNCMPIRPIQEGEFHYFEGWICSQPGTIHSITFGMTVYTAEGNPNWVGAVGINPSASTQTWQKISGYAQVPQNYLRGHMWVQVNRGGSDHNPAQDWFITNMVWRPASAVQPVLASIQSNQNAQALVNSAQAGATNTITSQLALTKNYTLVSAGSGSSQTGACGIYDYLGARLTTGGRSWNTFGISPTGEIQGWSTWDVFAGAGDALAGALNGNAKGTLTGFICFDEPSGGISPSLKAQLVDYGATGRTLEILPYRGAYILIGYKGCGEGGGIEKASPYGYDGTGNNWEKMLLSVINGWPVGLGGSQGALKANAATATIATDAQTRVAATEGNITALATRTSSLETAVGNNAAAITTVERVSAASASAAQIAANNAQGTANQAVNAASTAQQTADAANSQINNISSDSILSRGEKSGVILQWQSIDGERAGLIAQGNTFGIGGELTNYDASWVALQQYLVSLRPYWDDVNSDTAIDPSTFRAKFNALYVTRQALLNQISIRAKSLADAAQGAANGAQNSANAAQGTANQAVNAASAAQLAADAAKLTADAGLGLASNVQSKVNASYTVAIGTDSGGNRVATGFSLQSDGSQSSFVVLVDKFAIARQNQNGGFVYPFIVGNVNGVSTITINGNLVTDGTISASALRADALNAMTMDISGDRNGSWGFVRTNQKWYGDGRSGFITAFHPNGENFTEFSSGGGGVQFHSNGSYRLWGSGFNLDAGGLTINQQNVIGTGNVQGEAITVVRATESNWGGNPGNRTRVLGFGFDTQGAGCEFKVALYSSAGVQYGVGSGGEGDSTNYYTTQGIIYWLAIDGYGDVYQGYADSPCTIDLRLLYVAAGYRSWYLDIMVLQNNGGANAASITRSYMSAITMKR